MGFGDDMGEAMASALGSLPNLETLNLEDNMFSDKSLVPICNALASNKALVEINFSKICFGQRAAKALCDLLKQPNSTVKRLLLNAADIDDFEGTLLLESLKINRCIEEIDLSNNKLGQSENLNTVMPNLVTGPKTLANVLREQDCVLQRVNVSWNMIRKESAVDLCKSLEANNSLMHLDLGYNSIGREGGIEIGAALLTNKTLQTLNLSNNSLDAAAIITLVAGMMENVSLTEINLDGNPIADQGAKALMMVPIVTGSRIKISAKNCRVNFVDKKCPFDSNEICKKYEFHLSKPLDHACLSILLFIVASHHTYLIQDFQYTPANAKKARKLKLIPFWSAEKKSIHSDETRRRIETNLEHLVFSCGDVEKATELFEEVDRDGSGEIDREEFGQLMEEIGLGLTPEQLDEIYTTYDADDSNTIELDEFLIFLKHEYHSAKDRLRDLTHEPAWYDEKACAETGVKVRYIPPTSGTVNLSIIDGFTKKDVYRTLSVIDRQNILELAKATSEKSLFTLYGMMGTKIRIEEALTVYQTMICDLQSKIKVLSNLLPQLDSPADARILIAKALNHDKRQMLLLRHTLGSAVKPMTGIVNGYYVLDLSVELDRVCLTKLLEFSRTRANIHAQQSILPGGRVADLSQDGNKNSCFRNEIFNHQPIKITPEFANPMPRFGFLSFDFSGAERPDMTKEIIATDQKVVKNLLNTFLLPQDYMPDAFVKLERLRKLSKECNRGDGCVMYEADWDRAKQVNENTRMIPCLSVFVSVCVCLCVCIFTCTYRATMQFSAHCAYKFTCTYMYA
jgi:hypothetical protein